MHGYIDYIYSEICPHFLFLSKGLLVWKFVNLHLKICCIGIIHTPKYLLIFHRSKGLQSSRSYQISYVFLCPLIYGDFNTKMCECFMCYSCQNLLYTMTKCTLKKFQRCKNLPVQVLHKESQGTVFM